MTDSASPSDNPAPSGTATAYPRFGKNQNFDHLAAEPAGLVSRGCALFLDSLLVGVLLSLIPFALRHVIDLPAAVQNGSYVEGWMPVALFIYTSFFLLIGNTPGKFMCNLRVVDATTGNKPHPLALILRSSWYLLALIPHWTNPDPTNLGDFYAIVAVATYFLASRRMPHDLISHTIEIPYANTYAGDHEDLD